MAAEKHTRRGDTQKTAHKIEKIGGAVGRDELTQLFDTGKESREHGPEIEVSAPELPTLEIDKGTERRRDETIEDEVREFVRMHKHGQIERKSVLPAGVGEIDHPADEKEKAEGQDATNENTVNLVHDEPSTVEWTVLQPRCRRLRHIFSRLAQQLHKGRCAERRRPSSRRGS